MGEPELSEREKRACRAIVQEMNAYQRSRNPLIMLLRSLGVGYFQTMLWPYWFYCRRKRLSYWLRAAPKIVFAWADYGVRKINHAFHSLLDRHGWW